MVLRGMVLGGGVARLMLYRASPGPWIASRAHRRPGRRHDRPTPSPAPAGRRAPVAGTIGTMGPPGCGTVGSWPPGRPARIVAASHADHPPAARRDRRAHVPPRPRRGRPRRGGFARQEAREDRAAADRGVPPRPRLHAGHRRSLRLRLRRLDDRRGPGGDDTPAPPGRRVHEGRARGGHQRPLLPGPRVPRVGLGDLRDRPLQEEPLRVLRLRSRSLEVRDPLPDLPGGDPERRREAARRVSHAGRAVVVPLHDVPRHQPLLRVRPALGRQGRLRGQRHRPARRDPARARAPLRAGQADRGSRGGGPAGRRRPVAGEARHRAPGGDPVRRPLDAGGAPRDDGGGPDEGTRGGVATRPPREPPRRRRAPRGEGPGPARPLAPRRRGPRQRRPAAAEDGPAGHPLARRPRRSGARGGGLGATRGRRVAGGHGPQCRPGADRGGRRRAGLDRRGLGLPARPDRACPPPGVGPAGDGARARRLARGLVRSPGDPGRRGRPPGRRPRHPRPDPARSPPC